MGSNNNGANQTAIKFGSNTEANPARIYRLNKITGKALFTSGTAIGTLTLGYALITPGQAANTFRTAVPLTWRKRIYYFTDPLDDNVAYNASFVAHTGASGVATINDGPQTLLDDIASDTYFEVDLKPLDIYYQYFIPPNNVNQPFMNFALDLDGANTIESGYLNVFFSEL
jgi:hypothetical protein